MAVPKMRNYEDVSEFRLDPRDCEYLLKTQTECSFVWRMGDGWPIGVVMSYVWYDGKLWTTASSQRPRIAAVRRDNRVCVVISSAGIPMRPCGAAEAVHRDARFAAAGCDVRRAGEVHHLRLGKDAGVLAGRHGAGRVESGESWRAQGEAGKLFYAGGEFFGGFAGCSDTLTNQPFESLVPSVPSR